MKKAENLEEIGNAFMDAVPTDVREPMEVEERDEPLPHETMGEEVEEVEESPEEAVKAAESDESDLGEDFTVAELAEAIGVDPAYLYKMRLPKADGTSLTLGEWKDNPTAVPQDEMQNFQREQQMFQARQAIDGEYREKLDYLKYAKEDLTEKYKQINWSEAKEKHGDAAEVEKLRMQQQYSQIDGQLNAMQAEYDQKVAGYSGAVAQDAIDRVVRAKPAWRDPQVATTEMQAIHAPLKDKLAYDQIVAGVNGQIPGVDPVAFLDILELAAKGAAASNLTPQQVRKKLKPLRSGKSITRQQQAKMQQGKMLKQAKKGTRRERLAAAEALIAGSNI